MLVEVIRTRQGKNSTLSEIRINGNFVCYGLEDSVREVKIKGSTAIPAGRYGLDFNLYGAMNARYKRRFPNWHRGMIEIKDIPDFKYVYIHIGNTFDDTSGCLLVGEGYTWVEDDYVLTRSVKAYKKLYKLLADDIAEAEIRID